MSQWTHVNGNIRVDGVAGIIPDPDFKNLFKTCDFDEDETKWNACNVPKGSEGSLKINIWQNPHDSHAARFSIGIFGDLRDYSDKDEIKSWFEDICTKHDLMIRDAVVTCSVEYDAIYVFTFFNDKVYEQKIEREEDLDGNV
jgi:hypothetical protein